MATALNAEVMQQVRSPALRQRFIAAVDLIERAEPSEAQPRVELEYCSLSLMVWALTADVVQFWFTAGVDAHRDGLLKMFAGIESMLRRLTPSADAEPSTQPASPAEMADWLRLFTRVIAETPIERIEALAVALDEPQLGHDARTAYDTLRSFVRRNDPARAKARDRLYLAYRWGALSLEELAAEIGMAPSDAVFELEQHGQVREPQAIMLADAERDAIYARMRAQRLAHEGPPIVDPKLVERDVISSERIEGIDVRAWIRSR